MINLKKKLIFILFIILLISISGCTGKKGSTKSVEEIRTGTEGIVINFLPNTPPDKIHIEQGADESLTTFQVVLEVRNKGAYPQPDDGVPSPIGRIFLSGYDTNILAFDKNVEELSGKPLDGKSTINQNGGLDFITFNGQILTGNLNVENYEPIIQATACYNYITIAGPSVCIDPNPYSTVKEKKVCEVKSILLQSQGAPVAVINIDEEAFATKTQFKITIKNIGGGEVIHDRALDKCAPTGEKLSRENIDKVYLIGAKVGTKSLNCGPFIGSQGAVVYGGSGDIRLLNNEGFVICELSSKDYSNTKSAYTTPLTVNLLYGYRTTIEKKIQIKREASGLSSDSVSSRPVQDSSSPSNQRIDEIVENYGRE